MVNLDRLRIEVERELTTNILPYHLQYAVDETHGGFYGRIDNDNHVHPHAPKGVVQYSRLLWSYSQAYRFLKSPSYLDTAGRAFAYLMDQFWDKEAGGLNWLLDYQGKPLETEKYIYGQAFAIYGLAEYYLAAANKSSLKKAIELFRLIETYARDADHGGYFDVFQGDWDSRLEKNVDDAEGPVAKTMNTHLHLMEAYTNLLRAWPDKALRVSLGSLIRLHLDHIIDMESGNLRLHFKADWTPTNDHVSYGHDIEASWLIVEAAEVYDDIELLGKSQAVALHIARAIYTKGLDSDGGLLNEIGHSDKVWWPQAEALVGFFNAFHLSGDPLYLETVQSVWDFVKEALVDRSSGEWYWGRAAGGALMQQEKVGIWKTPYHNSRACWELMRRIDKLDLT